MAVPRAIGIGALATMWLEHPSHLHPDSAGTFEDAACIDPAKPMPQLSHVKSASFIVGYEASICQETGVLTSSRLLQLLMCFAYRCPLTETDYGCRYHSE